MPENELEILYLGELSNWLKLAEAAAGAPDNSLRVVRAHSLRDATRRLSADSWDGVLLDMQHPPAKELLQALQLRSLFNAVPAVAMVPQGDPQAKAAAIFAGAATCLTLDGLTGQDLLEAVLAAKDNKRLRQPGRQGAQPAALLRGEEAKVLPPVQVDAMCHALHNFLCVINANADILADKVTGSPLAIHSVEQIKKAANGAAELMRRLETT